MSDELPDLFGQTSRPPGALDIPPGTLRDVCAGPNCKAAIWIVNDGNGGRVVVDVKAADCFIPRGNKPGRGRPHYATCPDWIANPPKGLR